MSAVLETSARLLKLLSLLQARRDWTGADLAERLVVSVRTIRRDVDKLRDLGYPVSAATGTAGGYRLGAGAALPPLLLDDEEAVAVAVGLRTAAAVTGIEETSVRALAKLEQVLPNHVRRRVNALQSYIVPVPRTGPSVDPEVLTTLAAACRDHQGVRFDYQNHDGATSRRTTEPLRLVAQERRWYLVAWDIDRDDWRTFRVDRITLRSPAGPRFTPREPPSDDLAGWVTRGAWSSSWRYDVRVLVHTPREEIIARVPAHIGDFEAVDERTCVFSTGTEALETAATYLGLLGVDFEVLDPAELKDHLRTLSERFARAAV